MDENRIRSVLPTPWKGRLRQGIFVLGLAVVVALFILLRFRAKMPTPSHSIEVITYFEGDESPPAEEGDVVCQTNPEIVGAVGKVRSVRAVRDSGVTRWEVVMLLDRRYQSQIPADSVVRLTPDPAGYGNCGLSQVQWDAQFGRRSHFLEIDTSNCRWLYATPSLSQEALSKRPIEEHALLRSSRVARAWFCDVFDFILPPWEISRFLVLRFLIPCASTGLGLAGIVIIFRRWSGKERALRLPLFFTCVLPFFYYAITRFHGGLETDFSFLVLLLIGIVWALINAAVGRQRKASAIGAVVGLALGVLVLYIGQFR